MRKDNCRRAITRAEHAGVKIKLNQNYEEFYEINCSFRKKKGLTTYSEPIEFMKKYGTVFVAELDGEILLGHLYLEDKNNIRWLITASKRLDVNKEKAKLIADANKLTVWHTIKYAKDKGIKEFDVGGYYTGEKRDAQKENINIFKENFGGKLAMHYIYQTDYSKLFTLTNKIYNLKQSSMKMR